MQNENNKPEVIVSNTNRTEQPFNTKYEVVKEMCKDQPIVIQDDNKEYESLMSELGIS